LHGCVCMCVCMRVLMCVSGPQSLSSSAGVQPAASVSTAASQSVGVAAYETSIATDPTATAGPPSQYSLYQQQQPTAYQHYTGLLTCFLC